MSDESVFVCGDDVRARRRSRSIVVDTRHLGPILVPADIRASSLFVDSATDDDPRDQFNFSLDAANGSHRWTFSEGVGLTNLTAGDLRVFVGGGDGTLYAVDSGDRVDDD